MNRKNKQQYRRGDHVVILAFEHGDQVGTITTVVDIIERVLILKTKKRNLYGGEVSCYVAQSKNVRLATKEEKAFHKLKKKTTCNINKMKSKK